MTLSGMPPNGDPPGPAAEAPDAALEGLIQFLYSAPVGLIRTALDGSVEMINPTSARLLMPLSRDGGLDNLFVTLELIAPQLRGLVEAFDSNTGVVCEALRLDTGLKAAADQAPVYLSISLLKLDPQSLMAVLMDSTLEVQREQRGLARRLDAVARIDALTQMPNRTAVLELVQQAIDRASSHHDFEFAVVFMNCDRFKQINDTLGHAAGDQVLGLMADRLRSSIRQRQRVVDDAANQQRAARIGGDEFVVVLDGLKKPGDAHVVAQRLLDVLSKPYGVANRQWQCSISMGVLLKQDATADAATALQNASIAMVEAKRAGGGRYVVFEPSMHERAVRRGAVEADLRRALLDDQLFVVYQPVVGLKASGEIDRFAGVEALVRWLHPTRGIVPPLDFIGIAEESGLIRALGSRVLDIACRQFGQWQRELGERAPRLLAVNLSRGQLRDSGFVDVVTATLAACGIAPSQLQLEVTESLAAQDDGVQSQLHQLKALGVKLALDDFGTGYSSLSSLHQLPVDTVKIDRSFVSQALTSPHHRVLIEATIRVADSLGMNTIAEGIETPEQGDLLQQLGCHKGQGYWFGRPLSVTDLERWLCA